MSKVIRNKLFCLFFIYKIYEYYTKKMTQSVNKYPIYLTWPRNIKSYKFGKPPFKVSFEEISPFGSFGFRFRLLQKRSKLNFQMG